MPLKVPAYRNTYTSPSPFRPWLSKPPSSFPLRWAFFTLCWTSSDWPDCPHWSVASTFGRNRKLLNLLDVWTYLNQLTFALNSIMWCFFLCCCWTSGSVHGCLGGGCCQDTRLVKCSTISGGSKLPQWINAPKGFHYSKLSQDPKKTSLKNIQTTQSKAWFILPRSR